MRTASAKSSSSTLLGDVKILAQLALGSRGKGSHQERLEHFYRHQADHYDSFRERLLQGRRELFSHEVLPKDPVWIDMGGGTGASLLFWGDHIHEVKKGYIVDLCPSLLAKARQRIDALGLRHIEAAAGDVIEFVPSEGQADLVTFSYSLTMIPEWTRAIDHALSLLRPGGVIGVVDFFISRKFPRDGQVKHTALSRAFWPLWFQMDNVFLNSDHVPYLCDQFDKVELSECRAAVPYMGGLRVPYYVFLGRKPMAGPRRNSGSSGLIID